MNFPVLFYISLLVVIVTVLVGGVHYKYLSRPLRILEWLIVINILEVGVQWILISLHVHNLWTMHYFTIIELAFIVLMYSSWIKQRYSRLILFFVLAGFSILWIVSKFTFEPLSIADDGTATISKILQIIFSTYLLLIVVKESNIIWTDDPRLWIAAGVIIYSAGTLFWVAFFNKMLEVSPKRLLQSLSYNWILMIISNLFYMRGFLCKK